ncbi:MAG: PAS domain S-box protein [Gammaproteobacteria bacterium]
MNTLDHSHDYCQHLANSLADAVFLIKLPERVIELAIDTYQVLGYEPEEYVGETTQKFYSDPAEYEMNSALLSEAIQSGIDVLTVEALLRRKDGDIIPVEIRATIFREGGQAVSLTAMVRNITDRKRIEDALKASEKRFRSLMEQSQVSIQIHGLDGKLLLSNAAYCRLYALNEESLQHLYDKYNVLQDEQAEELGVMPFIKQTYRGENAVFPPYHYDGVDTLKTLDANNPVSRQCWVQTRGFPLKDEHGSIISVVFISEDVTEQRNATEQLSRSERRFRATFEQAAVGIAHVAIDGRFLRINQKYCDIIGYTQAEMLQLSVQDITHADDRDADLGYFQQLLAGEIATYSVDKRYCRKDGELVWVNRTVSLLRDEAEQPQWLVSVIEDISERKRTEQAVLDYQRRLKETAAELARTEERERRKIAAELHDNLGQSLAVLRMQLAAAKQQSSGRKVGAILDEVSDSLRDAIKDTRRIISELSSPLLDELGLTAAVSEWLGEKIEGRFGLQTRFSDDGEPKPLSEDSKTVLYSSVRELLMNVVKHAGAHRVSVKLQRINTSIRIIVEDDGKGLADARAPAKKPAEAGFGLFIVEERMNAIGGSLELESLPGNGVRATLVAPLDNE